MPAGALHCLDGSGAGTRSRDAPARAGIRCGALSEAERVRVGRAGRFSVARHRPQACSAAQRDLIMPSAHSRRPIEAAVRM